MKLEAVVDSVEVFEWYDGVVLGLVRAANLHALVFLLAFDPDKRRKKFCLFPLGKSEADALLALFKTQGAEGLKQSVFSKLATARPDAYFAWSEPEPGQTLELTEATPMKRTRLPVPFYPRIDDAVSESAISEWLSSENPH